MDRNSSANKKWGHDRFAVMLELYVYLHLGHYARYPEKVLRRKLNIDEAFAVYSHDGPCCDALKRTQLTPAF